MIRWTAIGNAYSILVQISREDGERPLHTLEGNNKIDYPGGEREVVYWVCVMFVLVGSVYKPS